MSWKTTKHIKDILEEYKNYIPCKVIMLDETIPDSDNTEDRVYVTTLVGGDCLSVTCACGAQYIMKTSELAVHRLDGYYLLLRTGMKTVPFGGIIIIIIIIC